MNTYVMAFDNRFTGHISIYITEAKSIWGAFISLNKEYPRKHYNLDRSDIMVQILEGKSVIDNGCRKKVL